MGTKTHPGKYDCYAKAEEHEPLFTLLARDPLAEHLVRIWAALYSGNRRRAIHHFDVACDIACDQQRAPDTAKTAKDEEAMRCAAAMRAFRENLPYCEVCLCTEFHPCHLPDGPCSWADDTLTVCSNPECIKLAAAARNAENKFLPLLQELPLDVYEWLQHLELHLTEHDLPHAGKALRAGWPPVRDYFLQLLKQQTSTKNDEKHHGN